ncbi:MAG: helix-turn-helix domain-containing protein [Clostridiales bacterium]|jgi:transcriptional regulator with XRE-family HTH domain|nr:helix-turn-helix domain-containing protein [Clostridiales bacterium]
MGLKENFSNRFRELRLKNNLQIIELARRLNISIRTINYYEDEKSITLPTVERLVQLSRFFNCSTDYLLGLSDSEK